MGIVEELFKNRISNVRLLNRLQISREAVIIDPVIETLERDLKVVRELGLNLRYALNTHVHADHVTGTGLLKKNIPGLRSLLSKASGGKVRVLFCLSC